MTERFHDPESSNPNDPHFRQGTIMLMPNRRTPCPDTPPRVTLIKSKRHFEGKTMKFISIVAAMFLLAMLGGCSITPNQQYKIDAGLYNGASITLNVARRDQKIDDTTWSKIQPYMASAKLHLSDARDWLRANPNLANTPGYPIPSLDPVAVALSVLLDYAGGFDLVPMNPGAAGPTPAPSTPATVPSTTPGG